MQIDRGGYFRNADGTRLAYREGGQAASSGAPVALFCYGLICSAKHFHYQWEFLGRTHRTLMLDYPGHEHSDPPTRLTDLSFDALARDLEALLCHAEAGGAAHVIAHSMGVNVALELARRVPERVASLSLIAGAAKFPARSERSVRRLVAVGEALKITDALAPALTERAWRLQNRLPGARRVARWIGFHPELTREEDLRACLEVFARFEPAVFFQLLGEYLRHDLGDRASELRVPTLLLAGGRDRIVPVELVRALHEAVPHSEFTVIEEGSHCPQLDLPDLVNGRLAEFLARV
ncbi:MAG: alpha/beta hydrolase [Bdellovibrionales bacterium]|nr:alpha/beta hydrolase [Bdellovibrionales bacterium]